MKLSNKIKNVMKAFGTSSGSNKYMYVRYLPFFHYLKQNSRNSFLNKQLKVKYKHWLAKNTEMWYVYHKLLMNAGSVLESVVDKCTGKTQKLI